VYVIIVGTSQEAENFFCQISSENSQVLMLLPNPLAGGSNLGSKHFLFKLST
jgi:hypothetical protein